eukprot:TRINITY_DN24471_c0_g1_i3.p1 TRINITY_DN24471_c0_g1~~TRINITY_DN24471_c0_g1_i3.p1  ORF type:complete len:1540 (+),score=354.62 TRINITY_DN24471_c0_g1_i3:78-4697(+)
MQAFTPLRPPPGLVPTACAAVPLWRLVLLAFGCCAVVASGLGLDEDLPKGCSDGTSVCPQAASASSLLQRLVQPRRDAASPGAAEAGHTLDLKKRRSSSALAQVEQEAAASSEAARRRQEAMAELRRAAWQDPSQTPKLSFTARSGKWKDFCGQASAALLPCHGEERKEAALLRRLHDSYQPSRDAVEPSARAGRWLLGNASLRYAGKTGSVCTMPTAAPGGDATFVQAPEEVKTSPISLIVDQTTPDADASTAACDAPYVAQRPAEVQAAELRQLRKLRKQGKLLFDVFPFEYELGGRKKPGRVQFAVVLPPVDCGGLSGCQTILFLHGLRPEVVEGPASLEGDAILDRLRGIGHLTGRVACEKDFNALRSILVLPILDNQTFLGAEEVIGGAAATDAHNWTALAGTEYTWYSDKIDMLRWMVVPLMEELVARSTRRSPLLPLQMAEGGKLRRIPRLPLDPDKVHAMGHSMGAIGAILAGLKYPELFASVAATSPCALRSSHFPGDMFAHLSGGALARPRALAEPQPSRMRRMIIFLGEEDNVARCLGYWGRALRTTTAAAAGGQPLSFDTQIRLMANRKTVNETGHEEALLFSHNGLLRFAWAEVDSALWMAGEPASSFRAALPDHAAFKHQRLACGCPADNSWVPLYLLAVLAVLRPFVPKVTQRVAKWRRSAQPEDMDVVVGKAAADAQGIVTVAQGDLGFRARGIVDLLELLPESSSEVAFLGTSEGDPHVTFPALRRYLASEGVLGALPKGLRYAVSLPAGRDLACVLLASIHAGTAAPLDPTMTVEELQSVFEQLRLQVVLCSGDNRGDAARVAANRLNLPVIECTPDAAGKAFPTLRFSDGDESAAAASLLPVHPWEPSDEERVVLLLRTSGTTSKGKVVPFSFRRLACAAQYNKACVDLVPGDVCLSMMPLYHIAGISVNLFPSLFAGSTVLLLDGPFEAKRFVAQLERQDRFQPTWSFAVPAVLAAVLNEAGTLKRPLKHRIRLLRSAGAALDLALGQRLVGLFDAALTPAYGMTEACEITCPPKDYRLERPGSVGPAMTCNIKEAVSKHPAVELCLAFAAPHASLGECIAVACVLREGCKPADATLPSVKAACSSAGLRRVMLPEVVVYCQREALPTTRTKKFIRTGLAARLGLTSDTLALDDKAFLHSAEGLTPLPEASSASSSEVVTLEDSMGQLRQANFRTQVEQNTINSLYGIVIINVMLLHWLAHDLTGVPVAPLADSVLTTFRSDKALMGLMFLLGGYSTATLPKRSFGWRVLAMTVIYVLLGWPLWFSSTAGIATFHRWFLLWAILGMLVAKLSDKLEAGGAVVHRILPVAAAYGVAPLLQAVPDKVGALLAGGRPYRDLDESWAALFFEAEQFWSLGHKVYWLAFFLAGYHWGPTVSAMLWELPERQRKILSSGYVRVNALLVACVIACLLIDMDTPHDETMPSPSLKDWPRFFQPLWAYPLRTGAEVLQLALLALAVGQGNDVLRVLGANILGTFVVHMYISTHIDDVVQTKLFQDMGQPPVLGGLMQLVLLSCNYCGL